MPDDGTLPDARTPSDSGVTPSDSGVMPDAERPPDAGRSSDGGTCQRLVFNSVSEVAGYLQTSGPDDGVYDVRRSLTTDPHDRLQFEVWRFQTLALSWVVTAVTSFFTCDVCVHYGRNCSTRTSPVSVGGCQSVYLARA